jgi:hypothetical protein
MTVETAEPQAQSTSPKKDLVLAALKQGKNIKEAAAEAGCQVQYARTIAQDAAHAASTARSAGLTATFDSESATELKSALEASTGDQLVSVQPGPDHRQIAMHIWPCVMERVARRLRRNDERFKNAAKDTFEAADCFLIKARGRPSEVVEAALIVWPAIWRDYNSRGMMPNLNLAAESAEMALNAAKIFLDHGPTP